MRPKTQSFQVDRGNTPDAASNRPRRAKCWLMNHPSDRARQRGSQPSLRRVSNETKVGPSPSADSGRAGCRDTDQSHPPELDRTLTGSIHRQSIREMTFPVNRHRNRVSSAIRSTRRNRCRSPELVVRSSGHHRQGLVSRVASTVAVAWQRRRSLGWQVDEVGSRRASQTMPNRAMIPIVAAEFYD